MQEWIDERFYQVGDAGAAIAGDEPEGDEEVKRMDDGGDSEDYSWFWLWKCLEYLFDFNIKTLSDRNQLNIIFYILLFILPKIIWIWLINKRNI